jgi:hypothetical protein
LDATFLMYLVGCFTGGLRAPRTRVDSRFAFLLYVGKGYAIDDPFSDFVIAPNLDAHKLCRRSNVKRITSWTTIRANLIARWCRLHAINRRKYIY